MSGVTGGGQMRIRLNGIITLAVVVAWTSSIAADVQPVGPHRLTLLDGRQTTGTVTGIDKTGGVRLAGQSMPIPLNSLRRLETGKAVRTVVSGTIELRLVADGMIRAKSLQIKNEKFHITWSGGADLQLPLEAVRSFRLKSAASPAFEKALASPSDDNDQIIVEIRGKLRTVRGLIETMDEKQIVLTSDGRKVSLPRAKLYGVVFAYVKKPLNRKGLCHVSLTDGSVLPGRIAELAKIPGKMKLTLTEGGNVSIDWNTITRIDITSDRLIYVSDLKPVDVTEQTIVALPQKWRKDRSVSGTTLKLSGQSYTKGIGVHARSQLTYSTAGKYETFAAVIGLDDAARRKGDCLFIVRGDGRELFRKRVQGRDKPSLIRVNIRGVQRVILLVEPGNNLDIADHADWCDARLILPVK